MGWMGPTVDNVDHEGWVVPLFADGAEGAGSYSSRGVLIAGTDDEWRPDDVVIGYAAACECGWRGPAWTRVRGDEFRANRANRIIITDGSNNCYLEGDAEDAVVDEWREHIAPMMALERLHDTAAHTRAVIDNANGELDRAVYAAREAGASWADIGRAARMTRQSANERWG